MKKRRIRGILLIPISPAVMSEYPRKNDHETRESSGDVKHGCIPNLTFENKTIY